MTARNGSSILWFLAGIGIGTAAGILYAPRSGSETREVLQTKVAEGREYVRNQANDVRGRASECVDKGRDVPKQQKDQIRADSGTAFQEVTSTDPNPVPNSQP